MRSGVADGLPPHLTDDVRSALMPEKTAYAPGEPTWVDLATPDPAASAQFYGGAARLDLTEPQPELGGYANVLPGDRKVPGLMPLRAPGQPTTWTCYLASDDADKTAELVEQAGGSTLAPPMDAAQLGRCPCTPTPPARCSGCGRRAGRAGAGLGATVVLPLTRTSRPVRGRSGERATPR